MLHATGRRDKAEGHATRRAHGGSRGPVGCGQPLTHLESRGRRDGDELGRHRGHGGAVGSGRGVASLVYLAGQIRYSREQMSQNTRAMQANTQQDIFENLNEILTLLTRRDF